MSACAARGVEGEARVRRAAAHTVGGWGGGGPVGARGPLGAGGPAGGEAGGVLAGGLKGAGGGAVLQRERKRASGARRLCHLLSCLSMPGKKAPIQMDARRLSVQNRAPLFRHEAFLLP